MIKNYSISLGKRQLVDSIWKSAGIEGLGITFPNTEKILDNLPVTTKQEEVFFVVNMKRAWEFLFDNIDYPVNISLLRELNKISMNELLYDAGEVRRGVVTIGGTNYIPEIPNSATIIEDLEQITQDSDKLDMALNLFCYIARTQIFTDGNKRLAQLTCNKVLMENDIGILSIPYQSIDEFKTLLVDFYETNDNTLLKDFFKDQCLLLNPDYQQNIKSICDLENR